MDKVTIDIINKQFERMQSLQILCKNSGEFNDYGDFESALLILHNDVMDTMHLNNAELIELGKQKTISLGEVRLGCRSMAEANRKVDEVFLDQETPMLVAQSLLRSREKKLHQYNRFSKWLDSYHYRDAQGILRTT